MIVNEVKELYEKVNILLTDTLNSQGYFPDFIDYKIANYKR